LPEAGIAIGGVPGSRVRVEPTQVKAEGGPFFPKLTIPINLDLNPGRGGQQEGLFVTLTIECGLFIEGYGAKVSDATLSTNPYPVRSSTSLPWNLDFPLDPYRVQGIEGKRHGDLKLRLDLAFVVAFLGRISATQGNTEVLTGLERSNSQIYIEVPQSHWVGKVLPALGSNTYFIVEVPARNERTATAWALIEKAETAFGRWDTKAVFAHCREAAIALGSLVEKHRPEDSFLKGERWGRAVKEFNHFASLDLHLEEKKANSAYSLNDVRIEKMDAECLLTFTKALAKYAEELLR
jgi:hypothetical protein